MVDPDRVGMLTEGLREKNRNRFRDSSMVDPDRVEMLTEGLRKKNRNRFRDSSMVEHSAVNRRVAGSSPARGANKPQ